MPTLSPLPPLTNTQTKVLCVDHDLDMLECLKSFLEAFGYTVAVTSSGTRAIEIATDWQADAVILDYNMPEMNGHQLANEIKGINSRVAVILLSGALDIPQETLRLVDAYVHKKNLASHLLPTISDLVCPVLTAA